MMRASRRLVLVAAAWVAAIVAATAAPPSSTEIWLRWVIPLPKEAKVQQQLALPVADVKITLRDGAGDIERNAVRQLRALFLEKVGLDATTGNKFEILLGVCDAQGKLGGVAVPDAPRLQQLPNREQAYLIRPVGTDRLLLTALDERGVFYAALTLRQLLEAAFAGETVTLPLAVITDWPDLAERGEWGCSSGRDIEWLAERKMNLVEFHTEHQVAKDGTLVTAINQSVLRRGRLSGVKMVPIISHLNGMGHRGAYTAYPELRGKGPKAVYKDDNTELVAPCASSPRLHEILAGWMCGYARYEGVRDISCWLGELTQRCECEQCAKTGQFALEARAFVQAWRLAVKQYPDLRIRILLTQGSYSTNDAVLAEVPPAVGVTYYDGSKTYDSSPEPMIYPLLEKYAAAGRWLGCYPQLTPSWRIVSPWSCPQFIKFRMTEFVDKKLASLGGYVVPDNRLFDFNVTAAAEWSWNAHGRSEREFALAWATRRGLDPVDTVADWAVMLGPVAWDLYGARLVERYFFNPTTMASMVAARTKPVFGKGLLTYIRDEKELQQDLAACRTALNLATRAGSPAMLGETKAILSYYEMVTELCGLCNLLAAQGSIGTAERAALQEGLNRLTLVGLLNVDALRDWERAVEVGAGGPRFREGVQATEDTVRAVARVMEPFGVRSAIGMVVRSKVGAWSSEDFKATAEIVKTFDVTEAIPAAGKYTVTFQYTSGYNGLNISRVALVSAPKAAPDTQTELSIDAHAGVTGARSQGNAYQLMLEAYDPACRYQVVARIRGVRPQDQKPEQGGCSGEVQIQRERDPDWQTQVMNVQAVTDPAALAALSTGFSGKGLRVGVILGGYGSESMLALLRNTAGLDAAAIGAGRLASHKCQVIVLPQSRSGMVPESLVQELEAFIRQGGGVIATHDAVGYRDMPKLCASVCAGGTEHVRAAAWQVAGTHPVTAGLAPDKVLSQGYFDHIEVACGPDGTVVASTEKTGKPVVVAGTVGKGRYVACGLLIGLDVQNREAAPTPDEAKLLLNAVRWCGQSK